MLELSRATSIHEAGHAVVSHLVGRRIMYAALRDERQGEVVPRCSCCDTCVEYFERGGHNPAIDPHSRLIQDDLRRSAAVAVAGELAERLLLEEHQIDEHDLKQDRELASSRVSLMHLYSDSDCFLRRKWKSSGCVICNQYLEALRLAVQEIITEAQVQNAVRGLADELEKKRWMGEHEIGVILTSYAITKGTAFSQLPPAP